MPDLFTTEQIEYLKKYFDDRYNERFVHVDICNETQEKNNAHFAKTDERVTVNEQKTGSVIWILKLIAAGIIGVLVTSILSLILK